ncbi:hypothetical protein JTB14_015101 [Gonioctena quinquepunctata]|nr:hypothetical protein JTB14_015101 [Gonioctena quinquepunctata]
MKAMVSKLKTKLNNQRKKYRRVKRQLEKVVKSVKKTPKTRIEEMSEDITEKKELVKKALFGEVIKIQLGENYTKIKSHEDKRKFKQALFGNVVDKYRLWRIPNKAVTFEKAGYNQPKKNVEVKMQSLVQQFSEDDFNSRQAAGNNPTNIIGKLYQAVG